jgi:hypothetical protein
MGGKTEPVMLLAPRWCFGIRPEEEGEAPSSTLATLLALGAGDICCG